MCVIHTLKQLFVSNFGIAGTAVGAGHESPVHVKKH